MNKEQIIQEIIHLRHRLHEVPEFSMQEHETRRILQEFLNITEPDDKPYILVISRGTARNPRRIAFRADFDAVCGEDGKPVHSCGHDGHAAILAGVCRALCSCPHENDLYFIFQPGEESGQGGRLCAQALADQHIDAVYGLHNIPGKPLGTVLLRDGTFACASTGLELQFFGAPSHAAYPENGINPGSAVARTLLFAEDFIRRPSKGMLLATVIGIDLGSAAYGLSAAAGTLRLTLRGEYQSEFEGLLSAVRAEAEQQARDRGLKLTVREVERFPATENHGPCVNILRQACREGMIPAEELSEPFRWSEDFGHYLAAIPGAFFGIGAGEDWPGLHTRTYTFPDEIVPTALEVFTALAEH